ncbi:MAG TPA: HTH domain-containing protein [Candidatus Baltobacteraceae bacterium]|nr:HTH domain-containing protein [Candidatus Baltobacteraceae bacterium]
MPKLNPLKVHAALANGYRWQIFHMLANGEEITLNDLVKRMQRSYRAVHKDMDVLCASGVIAWRLAEDKRVGVFFVPKEFRSQLGAVDLGFGQWRFPSAA